METLACALRTIAGKYNACAKHEDCLAAALEAKCSGAGFCPPYFVNRQLKAVFEAEAQHEIDRYCERGPCSLRLLRGDRYDGGILRCGALHLDQDALRCPDSKRLFARSSSDLSRSVL